MTDRTEGASRKSAPLSASSILGRLVGLAFIDAVALTFGYGLVASGLWLGALLLAIATVFINLAFLTNRLLPMRWISPALLLVVLMVLYPLLYTAYVAMTNYGQGHILSKEQVVTRLEEETFSDASFSWTAYRSEAGHFYLWLTDTEGAEYPGDATTGQLGPLDRSDPRFGSIDPADNLPTTIDGHQKITGLALFQYLTTLQEVRLQGEIDGAPAEVRIQSIESAILGQQKYTYHPDRDVIVDNETGVEYASKEGFFTAPDGARLTPGFSSFIGLDNFVKVFTDSRIQGPFVGVFIWTFTFSALSVLLTFAVGLGLALLLNDKQLPAKGLFRTLLVIPYTIPGFISVLVWVGLLNPLYGPINGLLGDVTGIEPRWFVDGTLAKGALLMINTWLGYPYMLLLSLGALQSIPSDMYEAAEIDGANPWQRFRAITLPMLLIALAPLLIGSFAFNFNNFTLIDLATEGGPPTPGAQTPAGQTDILITYSYRVAFASGRGQDYALAAAISTVIFVIVAIITLINFRISRRVENLV